MHVKRWIKDTANQSSSQSAERRLLSFTFFFSGVKVEPKTKSCLSISLEYWDTCHQRVLLNPISPAFQSARLLLI